MAQKQSIQSQNLVDRFIGIDQYITFFMYSSCLLFRFTNMWQNNFFHDEIIPAYEAEHFRSSLRVEIMSHELLVVWMAYCLVPRLPVTLSSFVSLV